MMLDMGACLLEPGHQLMLQISSEILHLEKLVVEIMLSKLHQIIFPNIRILFLLRLMDFIITSRTEPINIEVIPELLSADKKLDSSRPTRVSRPDRTTAKPIR